MDISYKGTAYHGWQIQANSHTVQAEIENALQTLLKTPAPITASGRTDAGVHASQQIAHFDFPEIIDTNELCYKLNSFLPLDISINKIWEVSDEAHARFSATKRTYHYHLHQFKNPFNQELSYYFTPLINVDAINSCEEIILNWQNFECFSKVHTEVNNFNCEIFEVKWAQHGPKHLFTVSANRFLRGMVRAMVGTLLDVGTGKKTIEDLKSILKSGDRKKAGRAVPAHGLFLEKVEYGKDIDY